MKSATSRASMSGLRISRAKLQRWHSLPLIVVTISIASRFAGTAVAAPSGRKPSRQRSAIAGR